MREQKTEKSDIYLCSTVRHLLFSLMRSLYMKKSADIIMITDQQKISSKDFNIGVLPDYISINFVNRKEVISSFNSGNGRIKHGLLIATSVYGFASAKSSSRNVLGRIFPDICFESSSLFLFNDRNRLSRIFRLAFDDYSVIEDGYSNYIRSELNVYERCRRIITGHKSKTYKILGDENQCKEIYLLNYKQADSSILDKVLPINFVLPDCSSELLLSFFNCTGVRLDDVEVIVATQPIMIDRYTDSGRDSLVYTSLAQYFDEIGKKYVVKVHPRENETKYKDFFPNGKFISSKIPLEMFLLLTKKKPKIVSIYSTAGMGFESYCERYTLVGESESQNQSQLFNLWEEDKEVLLDKIRKI